MIISTISISKFLIRYVKFYPQCIPSTDHMSFLINPSPSSQNVHQSKKLFQYLLHGPISLANDKKSGNLNLNHYQCACIKPFISSILHLKSCSYNTVAFKVVIPGAKACLLGKGHLFPFTNLVVFLSEEPVWSFIIIFFIFW